MSTFICPARQRAYPFLSQRAHARPPSPAPSYPTPRLDHGQHPDIRLAVQSLLPFGTDQSFPPVAWVKRVSGTRRRGRYHSNNGLRRQHDGQIDSRGRTGRSQGERESGRDGRLVARGGADAFVPSTTAGTLPNSNPSLAITPTLLRPLRLHHTPIHVRRREGAPTQPERVHLTPRSEHRPQQRPRRPPLPHPHPPTQHPITTKLFRPRKCLWVGADRRDWAAQASRDCQDREGLQFWRAVPVLEWVDLGARGQGKLVFLFFRDLREGRR